MSDEDDSITFGCTPSLVLAFSVLLLIFFSYRTWDLPHAATVLVLTIGALALSIRAQYKKNF